MANHALRNEWEGRIADFASSGQSGAAWCAENQVNLHQFYYWKRRLASTDQIEDPSPKWLSLEICNASQEPSAPILIRTGEVTIEIKQGYSPDLLLDVIRTLRALC